MSLFTTQPSGVWVDGVEPDKEDIRVLLARVVALLDGGIWQRVTKTADQTKNSTTALAADTALVVPMLANSDYIIRGKILFDTVAAADFKWRHVGPAAPTRVRVHRNHIIPGTTAYVPAVDVAYSAGDITVVGTGTTGGCVAIEAWIRNGGNAGNFEFHWAQNTSDAGDTKVLLGSYLEYAPVPV